MAKTRQTLLVTEKPSQAKNILPHWQEHFPDDEITQFHTPPIGSFRFRLPRDLPLSSVPIIADPILERRPPGVIQPPGVSPFDGDFGALARAADHIVCATGFDPAGCRNFLDLMTQYRVETPLSEISWLALRAEDATSVTAGIAKNLHADNPEFARMAAIGQARQYFNHLYLVNALPVFGLALRAAGIDPTGKFSFLSKYTLQMLLLLARLEPGPLLWKELIKLMVKDPGSQDRSQIGSPMSREAIVSWLWGSGCLTRQDQDGPVRYVLSDRGRRLAGLIHKDCFDPHLSSRLEGWGETWPASKPAIERYVRTFFGKEKRFLLRKV